MRSLGHVCVAVQRFPKEGGSDVSRVKAKKWTARQGRCSVGAGGGVPIKLENNKIQ